MDFKQKEQKNQTTETHGVPDKPEEKDNTVLVSHGIHKGKFNLRGMTVTEARGMLKVIMNVSPKAVAVIGGEIVEHEDETRIGDDVNLLSFVNKSSVKGGGRCL